jgi:EAL domain-containing protein (putative c-di-GMP-specific phosphodiesterase class I)
LSTEKKGALTSLEYLVEDRFLDRMDEQLSGWRDPPARLRTALERDEFELYCQPIASLTQIAAFPLGEVLVRMREEERALLPPGEFLPAFEHYGMMAELDRWVLRNAVRHMARGSRIPHLTVNVSNATLKDAQFPAFAEAELRAAGVPMDAVLFEIDESDVLARLEAAARFSAAVKAYGGGVLIDGFCRRAVSFAPLKKLRADYVKVDGCVTRTLLASEAADTKLKAVLSVAEMLDIGVVAECVEEEDVLARLRELKVGYAQGFGVEQPQPITQIALKP